MNSQLESILRGLGATITDGAEATVRDFGAPGAERAAAAQAGYAADVSHFGVLEFTGADATAFLHNQLSCDVAGLPGGSSYGSYCTPKGRMLAVFLLWRELEGPWRMLLPRAILAATAKRLKMFVLRSKVAISDASDSLALIGAGGPAAAAAVGTLIGPVPPTALAVHVAPAKGTLIGLPGARCLLVLPVATAAAAWSALAASLKPVGAPVWDWTDIRNGIAFVWPATQEQFVPQMTNLELIGGVSFKKGCYPGQEIVARTQYLGKLKRRLFLAHVEADAAPGDELYGEDVDGQSNGRVASAAPAPRGGTDLLAVVQSASAESSRVHLRSAGGPLLAFEPLPYPVV